MADSGAEPDIDEIAMRYPEGNIKEESFAIPLLR